MSSRRSVLITGCSDGGIGCALAHAMLAKGFHVFATARDTSKMASFANKLNVTRLALDVTSDEQVAQVLQMVEKVTGGKLDCLINNAARNHFMPLTDESIEEVKALFDTNVFGPLRMIKAFAPLVIKAKGTIVDIDSMSGYLNMPWMGSYAATKRSVEIMGETLRLELQPFGVRVLSLVTGPVDTNGLTYFGDFKLPQSSVFKSIEPTIKGRANGAGRPEKVETPDEYAAKVLPKILSGKTGVVWAPGMMTGFVKFAVSWLPTSVTDSMWVNGTGVSELSTYIQANKA